jgi:hypothetical protein
MAANEKLDVLGTFLRTSQQRSPAERIVWACGRLGGQPRISHVFDALGMTEDEFAQAVGEAERRGLVFREKIDGQVNLTLTPSGRQLWEQSLPQ